MLDFFKSRLLAIDVRIWLWSNFASLLLVGANEDGLGIAFKDISMLFQEDLDYHPYISTHNVPPYKAVFKYSAAIAAKK